MFVLIDEVESLTAARRAAVAGSEPSDAIRAVNAMLTHLDALRCHPNVMVLCTSNLPEAVDVAFVDRADIKVRRSASSGCVGPLGGRSRVLVTLCIPAWSACRLLCIAHLALQDQLALHRSRRLAVRRRVQIRFEGLKVDTAFDHCLE